MSVSSINGYGALITHQALSLILDIHNEHPQDLILTEGTEKHIFEHLTFMIKF